MINYYGSRLLMDCQGYLYFLNTISEHLLLAMPKFKKKKDFAPEVVSIMPFLKANISIFSIIRLIGREDGKY